jgi:hypothetical protein
VTANIDMAATGPVFKKCVRCGYSLRGLPANHTCPECGLRYDEQCALFRVTNPKQLVAFWAMIFGGGWIVLRYLPGIANLGGLSTWKMIGALAAVLWVICVLTAMWFLVRHYRRGFKVAITSDGLIVHLPGFSDDLIPWGDIREVSIMDRPTDKPQIASVFLKSKNKTVAIGGVANVFPKRADVERFVGQVAERLDADGA